MFVCLGFGWVFSPPHIPRVYTQGGRLTPRPLQALLPLPPSKGGEGSPPPFRRFSAATGLPCGDVEDGKYPLRLGPALPASCRPALRAAAALLPPRGLGAASIPCRGGALPQPEGQGDAAGVLSCQAGRHAGEGRSPATFPAVRAPRPARPPPTHPCGDLAAGGEAPSVRLGAERPSLPCQPPARRRKRRRRRAGSALPSTPSRAAGSAPSRGRRPGGCRAPAPLTPHAPLSAPSLRSFRGARQLP